MERFADNALRYNVLEEGKPSFGRMSGKWRNDHFNNANKLVVELGCGRGEYTTGLAAFFPEYNFIGVDIKGARIWVGSSHAIENNMNNVAFLRAQIEQIDAHFGTDEIDELWITFPDPRSKDKDEKKRLTSPRFMQMYKSILTSDGWVKFKTDSTFLFDYTLDLIESKQLHVKNLSYTKDLYKSEFMNEHFGVKTKYEDLFHKKGESIKYMKFQFI